MNASPWVLDALIDDGKSWTDLVPPDLVNTGGHKSPITLRWKSGMRLMLVQLQRLQATNP